MKAAPIRLDWIAVLALASVASVLVWQVITRSFVAYLSEIRPELALKLRPTEPLALLNRVAEAVDQYWTAESRKSDETQSQTGATAKPAGETGAATTPAGQSAGPAPMKVPGSGADVASLPMAQIRSWAETAVEQEPLSARGLRLLGELDQIAQQPQSASRFFDAAARLSLQEWRAVRMSMLNAFESGDYVSSARFADVLLRTHPQLISAVTPTLAQMSENDKAIDAVDRLLAAEPPWRKQFFDNIANYITDARTPMHLLLNLRATPAPPSVDERAPYLRFLIDHKFYDLAYYVWLQFLSADELARAGLLYNGGFEQTPSGLPFDWVIGSGKSVSIDTISERNQRGARSLSIEFGNGRVEFPPVGQMTMLPPATYTFKGKYKGEVRGVRGLVWRIECVTAPAQPPIGESQMVLGATPQWTDFQFAFTVPAEECRAQHVSLVLDARSASETLVSGSILYDDLEIVRE